MNSRRPRRCLAWDHLEDRLCQSSGASHHVVATTAIPTPAVIRMDEAIQAQLFASNNALLVSEGQAPVSLTASTTPTPQYNTPINISDLWQYEAEAATQNPNIIFLGDSITWRFANPPGQPSWNQDIAPLGALPFGVQGDTTENLLWREENGDLASHPKVAVVDIGLNNLSSPGGYESISETVTGVKAVVETIRVLSPQTKILLLGVFPTGSPTNWLRGLEYATNLQLARMANGNTIRFSNPGWKMVGPDGSLGANLWYDNFHPSAQGYAVVGAALTPVLEQMLSTPARPSRG
jgi:lysophospholipase L1-like esterase